MAESHYPEHEKLKDVEDQSQAIYDFLDWAEEEHGVRLQDHDGFTPRPPLKTLLAEFFEIDLTKLEEEKDQMLADLRALQDG